MHYNISKLLLCFLFGMNSSEYYASSASARASAQMYRDRINDKGIGDISGLESGKTRKSLKKNRSSNSSDTYDSGTSTTQPPAKLARLSIGAAVIGAKSEQVEASYTPKRLATHVASQHVSDSHVTEEGKKHLSSIYPDAVVKLITGTKEGYMFEHMSLLSNFKSTTQFMNVQSDSKHTLPTGGPLSNDHPKTAVRAAYEELVNQVTASKTSKDFEMLLASTGGTIDGKALESDKSNSHQQLLTGELNKVSVTINGITYTGVDGLKQIEEKLQSSNLSVVEKTALAGAEDQLSKKLADTVTSYREKYDSRKNLLASSADDIYFNKNAYEEYTTKLEKNSLYQSVLKTASEHSETLTRIGAMDSAALKEELLALAGSNTLEKHHLANTLGLIDATNAAYTHIKDINLEKFTNSHPSASSEYTNSDNGKAHEALKAFYNSIPLSYDGIMSAISVTGGSDNGTSNQDAIKTKYASELDALQKLHNEFTANPTDENQKKITAAAEALRDNILNNFIKETIDFNKKDNAYLHYGELMTLHENREKTYSAHYEQISSIYHMHETMTAAHTAAVNNAKKTSTSD